MSEVERDIVTAEYWLKSYDQRIKLETAFPCMLQEARIVIADLRAKLEAAEEDKKDLADTLNKSFDCIKNIEQERDNLQAALELKELEFGELENHLALRGDANQKLQAQVGVLRVALEGVTNKLQWAGDGYCPICGSEEEEGHKEPCDFNIARQALSTTPEQAGEKVRGLVEALESISKKVTFFGVLTVPTDAAEIAIAALAKFRGGANNANT